MMSLPGHPSLLFHLWGMKQVYLNGIVVWGWVLPLLCTGGHVSRSSLLRLHCTSHRNGIQVSNWDPSHHGGAYKQ